LAAQILSLNSDNNPVIAKSVNRWKAILSLLLLAMWMPAALPCELKAALFPALDCCSTQNHQHNEKTDCDNCQICKGVVISSHEVSVIRASFPGIAPFVRVDVEPQDLILNVFFPTWPAAPPDSLPSWQFDLRAALPVRAPSFVS
jgi:hypothetical protein